MVSREDEALAASAFSSPNLAGLDNCIQSSCQNCPRDRIGRIARPRRWQAAKDGARRYIEPDFAGLTTQGREEGREDVRKHHTKAGSPADKISKTSEQHTQQLVEVDWIARETWEFLKHQYTPKG